MKTRSFQILIPFAPDTINTTVKFGYTSTLAVTNLKLKWQDYAERYLLDEMHTGRLPECFHFPIRVSIHLYFTKLRTRDEDNYYVMSKGIIDALTSLRMIRDDAGNFVSFGGVVFHIDDERPRVIVEISEIMPFHVDDERGVKIHEFYAD